MLSCIPKGHLACRIYAHLAYFHSTDTAMGKRGRDRMNEALEQEQQEEMAETVGMTAMSEIVKVI